VLAILSIAFGVGSWVVLPFLGAIAAVTCGHLARKQIRETGEDGDTLAVLGLVFGWAHIAFVVILLVALGMMLLLGFTTFWAASGQHP